MIRVIRHDVLRKAEPLDRFLYYISERYRIRLARLKGEPRPWTRDPILQQYKFTNVKREWDYTSVWLREHWYFPHRNSRSVGFACAIARFINSVPTLAMMGYPASLSFTRMEEKLKAWRASGHPVFSSAYILAGGIPSGADKVHHLVWSWLHPVWRSNVLYKWYDDPWDLHNELLQFHGWGHFLTQEVVLDWMGTQFADPVPAWRRRDYGVAGPGAIRGIKRVLGGKKPTASYPFKAAQEALRGIHDEISNKVPNELRKDWTLHDTEFNLCEFDKYERTLWGEGTPKHRFTPRTAERSGKRAERERTLFDDDATSASQDGSR